MRSSQPEHGSHEHAAELYALRSRNAELERDLARYRVFADSIEEYALIALDSKNRITNWNRGAERLTGYTESEALGRPGAILFTPEDRERREDENELETARLYGHAEDERWHVRKDGTRFWGSGLLSRMRKGDGYVKVFRDLTERRQAVEAPRASEERCRLFIENVGDYALFQVDLNGCISSWNMGAQRMFGYAEQEIVGQPVEVLFLPEERERHYPEEELARAMIEGKVSDEMWVLRKDGTRFFATWGTHTIHDEYGVLRGFTKVMRDETDRRRSQEERQLLQQLERDLLAERATSNAAALDRTKEDLRQLTASLMTAQEDERRRIARDLHDDLAQRLASLQIGVERLRSTFGDGAEHFSRNLELISRQVSAITDEVRNLSHRVHPAALEHLGLIPALRQLVQEFERTNGLAIRLNTDVPQGAGIPMPVATALYRIVQEALRNVSKHANHALVTISVTTHSEELRVEVSDDGPGFEPASVEPGLGLITMRERAALAGGTCDTQSAPGVGTSVIVTVPCTGLSRTI